MQFPATCKASRRQNLGAGCDIYWRHRGSAGAGAEERLNGEPERAGDNPIGKYLDSWIEQADSGVI